MLVSHKPLLETGYNRKEFALYVDLDDPFLQKYVFIVSSAIKTEMPPSYGYIEFEGHPNMSIEEDLKDSCKDDILSSISDPVSIEAYMEKFKPILTTKYLKKQPDRRRDTPEIENVEQDQDQEQEQEQEQEAQPIAINVHEEIVVPDLNAEPVARMKAKTKRNKNPKKPENVHKPRTKKTLPMSEVSS
jgi:hypothetical protein